MFQRIGNILYFACYVARTLAILSNGFACFSGALVRELSGSFFFFFFFLVPINDVSACERACSLPIILILKVATCVHSPIIVRIESSFLSVLMLGPNGSSFSSVLGTSIQTERTDSHLFSIRFNSANLAKPSAGTCSLCFAQSRSTHPHWQSHLGDGDRAPIS